jgi:glyoxylase I family protein
MPRTSGALAALAILTAATSVAAQPAKPAGPPVERVEGIGGFFFRSEAPGKLAQWYADNLGVTLTPRDYGQQPWRQAAGPTAFQPFPGASKMFGRPDRAFMLNFRVRDLDAMVAQLRRADIDVEVDPKTYPNGRFASLKDPEDNPIQLWQPRE